ncbi:hypothetical protein psal_cds_122 [Pandoravirus salinus]|uniref:Uncharacterized protein n=1 Tax=Pandoravirus salinus TaxID=1349410 RepID=S4VZT8_9VIRU|nr:hypothetical protein psal_cds_122 [Pandoravirus salinus]AGO83572.1 hypothetical protein psal_cds_122 [Pandoravirus salinus]
MVGDPDADSATQGATNDDDNKALLPRLPPEVWACIVEASDRRAAAALAATCTALWDIVSERARATVRDARAAMNTMTDEWERHTAHWDDVWMHSDTRGRCYACASQNRIGGANASRWRSRRRWISDCGTPDDPTATDLCDACALAIARDIGAWPMRRVDLDAPHVWSVGRTICDVLDVLPSGPIAEDRFVVPPAATYMVDPSAPEKVAQWTPGEVEVGFAGLRPSRMPSVRAWLPLTAAACSAHVCMICVCCDSDSPLWGVVAAVQWWPRASFIGWTRVADSIEQAAARRRHARGRHRRGSTLRADVGVPRVGLVEALLAEAACTTRPPHGA